MSWSKKHPMTFVLTAAIAVTVGLVGVSSLRADGVPEMNTLAYTGRLVEDGVPVDGMRDIRITLWSHPDSTDAATYRLCRVVPAADTLVQDGYFRIPLDVDDDTCETAVTDNSDVWVEVAVEGTTLSPRTQIAAVPYALEANRASSAAGDLRRELDELVPAGTIIAYGGEVTDTVVPPGWLLCDGRALSSTDPQYMRLFLAIRTAWGNGTDDGEPSTDFNVPDLRGRFVRGVDQTSGHDPDAASRLQVTLGGNEGDAVGTIQGDATSLPNAAFTTSTNGSHTHGFNEQAQGGPNSFDSGSARGVNGFPHRNTETAGAHSHTVAGGGDSETRPANAAVNYLIHL